MQWWTLQQLKSKDVDVRLKAVEKLALVENETVLEPLLKAAQDGAPEVRQLAIRALGRLKSPKVGNTLIQALRDPAGVVREAAADAARTMGFRDARDSLVPMLADEDVGTRAQAASALESFGWQAPDDRHRAMYLVARGKLEDASKLGSVAIDYIVTVLRGGLYYKRLQAVGALAGINNPAVVKPLMAALKDEDSIVRTAAVEALASIGDARAVEPLLLLLRDRDGRVRAAAIDALSRIGDSRAIAPLAKMVTDSNWDVRAAVVAALGRFKDPAVIDPLVNCLKDRDRDTRLAAVNSLGKLKEPRAVQAIVMALVDEHEVVRQAAAGVLRRIDRHWELSDGARAAVPDLREAAGSSNYWIRQSAIDVLGKLGVSLETAKPGELNKFSDPVHLKRQAAIEALSIALRDEDRDLRQAATEALGRLAEPRTADELVRTLEDSDEWVRRSAAQSLEALNWLPADKQQRARQFVILQKWQDAATMGEVAVESLAESLQNISVETRRRAAETLGCIKCHRAIDALVPALNDLAAPVRQAAAEALDKLDWQNGALPDQARHAMILQRWDRLAGFGAAAIAPLVSVIKENKINPDAHEAARGVLGMICSPEAVEALLQRVHDPEVAGPVVSALTNTLTLHAGNLAEDELFQLANLPDSIETVSTYDPLNRMMMSSGQQVVDCGLVRQAATDELTRRSAAVHAA